MSWLSDFILKVQDFFRPTVDPVKPMIVKSNQVTENFNVVSNIPQCGIDLINSFEKCELSAYQDQGGIWTIAWGRTKNVKQGDTCTQAQADAWRQEDLAWVADVIFKYIKVPLTSNQKGGLASLVYNLGQTRFEKEAASLIFMLNSGNYAGVPNKIKQYIWYTRPDGSRAISKGLVNRRQAEASLFIGADWRKI